MAHSPCSEVIRRCRHSGAEADGINSKQQALHTNSARSLSVSGSNAEQAGGGEGRVPSLRTQLISAPPRRQAQAAQTRSSPSGSTTAPPISRPVLDGPVQQSDELQRLSVVAPNDSKPAVKPPPASIAYATCPTTVLNVTGFGPLLSTQRGTAPACALYLYPAAMSLLPTSFVEDDGRVQHFMASNTSTSLARAARQAVAELDHQAERAADQGDLWLPPGARLPPEVLRWPQLRLQHVRASRCITCVDHTAIVLLGVVVLMPDAVTTHWHAPALCSHGCSCDNCVCS